MENRPLLRKVITLLMLGSLALLVCAEFVEAACPEEDNGTACGAPFPGGPGGPGSPVDREAECDHCLTCQIVHGHVTTLAAERHASSDGPLESRVPPQPPQRPALGPAAEIDHVPIVTA